MEEEYRFVVKKSTRRYVHPWTVIDTQTGKECYGCETEKLAQIACDRDNRCLTQLELADKNRPLQQQEYNDAWEAYKKRMRQPNGDPLPRHSNKRPVELD